MKSQITRMIGFAKEKAVVMVVAVFVAAVTTAVVPTQALAADAVADVKIGDVAPDFTLVDQNGQLHSLHDYKGKKNVALAFYVFGGSGCAQQMRNLQQNLAKLEAADTQILGVSMDGPFANKAFADQNGITFPLLSDRAGKIIREYGIYKEYDIFNTTLPAARRTLYLIDTNGKVIEMQVDSEAIDPAKTVAASERRKVKETTSTGGSSCF